MWIRMSPWWRSTRGCSLSVVDEWQLWLCGDGIGMKVLVRRGMGRRWRDGAPWEGAPRSEWIGAGWQRRANPSARARSGDRRRRRRRGVP
uniref:Uncharacterized protein n=1 Tax=Arundo donax TaxID=35708 RepID=A0A0A9CBD8_ARUDO